MVISFADSASILRKWRDERRLIQVGLISSIKTGAHVIGRIEHLDDESLRIDASSIHPRGGRGSALVLEFAEAKEFRFEDWRDAPPEYAEQLRQGFEAALFVNLGNCQCELYAAKTDDEFRSMERS